MRSLSLLAAFTPAALACTTIVVGRAATTDGSVIVTHSNDGEGATDPRLVHIPAQTHSADTMRPIFYAPESYPRYVGSARGKVPAYAPVGNQTVFTPIGQIPEVPSTFSYFEETYGSLNEHQLGIGESTCSGVFGTKAAGHGGKALMSVDTLSQLAMERTKKARDAIQLMGEMAVKYGFYGAGSFEGSAESLLVSDPTEGWIFHILPDDTGTSAIWAAQRVPDDHVGVVANAFVIREVNFSDTKNFLGSDTVHSVAIKKGWWKPSDGHRDFSATYSDGEYAHKFYSGRRMWGVYRLLSSKMRLSPDYDEYLKSRPYPVTAPVDKKVTVADVAKAMRSYYEGSDYDQTVTHAAGPWGTPDHVAGGSSDGKVKGNWERTIGLYRTSDSYIVQSGGTTANAVGGVIWFGAHAAPYTAYVPLPSGMLGLPDATLGHPAALHKPTLFWAVRYLANLAQLKRNHMISAIDEYQQHQHAEGLALLERFAGKRADASPAVLNATFGEHATTVVKGLWQLIDDLMFKYADGYTTTVTPNGALHVASEGYPDWWLKEVGYTDGPPPVPPKKMVMVGLE